MTLPVASELWRVLEEAAGELTADWHQFRQHAGSDGEVGSALAAMLGALRGEGPAPTGSPLCRRLLAGLRRKVVLQVTLMSPAPSLDEALHLLGALEQLATEFEPGWHGQFADQLAGPDGLELVVEVAHDLRSPLTSILFLAETLQKGRSGPVTPLQERQLGLIYAAAFGLSAVASDVIELARGGDRLVDLDPLPFSVADILESVRDIVLPIAEEKGLALRFQGPTRNFRIGHPVAINRVLLNLTTNALKFSDQGYVEMSALDGDGTAVEFVVRDTGRGIPESGMARLFEPFRRRQDERDYAFSGSGLGLSICRKLVEAMGAELRVDTREGEGTRFSFTLDLPFADFGDRPGGADA